MRRKINAEGIEARTIVGQAKNDLHKIKGKRRLAYLKIFP